MAAAAIICLPRQFHVTVVDNQDKRHLYTARWAFPLYLLLTAAMIFPIATAAIHPGIGSGFSPDSFVLALPLMHENAFLTTFVFIGGSISGHGNDCCGYTHAQHHDLKRCGFTFNVAS